MNIPETFKWKKESNMRPNQAEQHLVMKKLLKWADGQRLSLADIARELGVKPQNLTNWKTRGMPVSMYQRIAGMMNVPLEILTAAEGELEIVTEKIRMLPVIDSVHAGHWTGIGDATFEEYMPIALPCSENSFCLRVEGKSMLPVFLEGDTVIVDPEVLPSAGKYVVARRGDRDETTVKRYRALGINDAGQDLFELVPENPDFESFRSDRTEIVIVGTVIGFNRKL